MTANIKCLDAIENSWKQCFKSYWPISQVFGQFSKFQFKSNLTKVLKVRVEIILWF